MFPLKVKLAFTAKRLQHAISLGIQVLASTSNVGNILEARGSRPFSVFPSYPVVPNHTCHSETREVWTDSRIL